MRTLVEKSWFQLSCSTSPSHGVAFFWSKSAVSSDWSQSQKSCRCREASRLSFHINVTNPGLRCKMLIYPALNGWVTSHWNLNQVVSLKKNCSRHSYTYPALLSRHAQTSTEEAMFSCDEHYSIFHQIVHIQKKHIRSESPIAPEIRTNAYIW